MKRLFYLFLTAATLFTFGCTDLREEILDESSGSDLSSRQTLDGLIAPVYALLPELYTHTRYFALQEITSDEAILPYRGGTDWGDNGIYLALHDHGFDANNAPVRNTWNSLLPAISRAVTAIDQLPDYDDALASTYLAEARGMRAFYSMLTLDLYDVVFVKEDVDANSTVLRGGAALDYVIGELEAVEPLVAENVGPGRLDRGAVRGLLARLYLNAAVYRDRYAADVDFSAADMDRVIEYCDAIINSGNYALAAEYFSLFDDDNHDNPELIFAVDQVAELNGHNRMAYFSLSGDVFPLPDFPSANGTDGPAITSDYYQTWAQAYAPADPSVDPRFFKQNLPTFSGPDTCMRGVDFQINRGILRGQQYGLLRETEGFILCGNGDYLVGPLAHRTRSRPDLPVNHTEQVDFTVEGSNYPSGYRVEKYAFSAKSNSGRNNGDADIVILRLADVYLMRAEALLRRDGDEAAALADVNTVRAARTARLPAPPALEAMDLDLLYRERGFEFYWEHQRRTDMIRFGKFEDSWTEKTDTDPHHRVFPLPQTAIDGASNSPGYLEQNPGY